MSPGSTSLTDYDRTVVHVPIICSAAVLRNKERKPRRVTYEVSYPFQMQTLRAADVAYTVRLAPDVTFDVFVVDRCLYWPLSYVYPYSLSQVDALEALSAGKLDLLGTRPRRVIVVPFDEKVPVRKITWIDRDHAIAYAARKLTNTCLIIGGELYGRGGIPLIVHPNADAPAMEQAFVTSAGAGRDAEFGPARPAAEPGGFHLPTVQWLLANGYFEASQHSAPKRQRNSQQSPLVVAHIPQPFDRLRLRVDTLFRIQWADLKSSGLDWEDGVFAEVHQRFREALDGDLPDLTALRCDALQALLAVYGRVFPGTHHQQLVIDVLEMAAEAGLTASPDKYRLAPKHRLSKEDDNALAAIGG